MHFTVRISGRKPYESNCSKLDAKRKHVEPSFNAATSALDARSRRFQESGALRTPQVLISNRQKAIQRVRRAKESLHSLERIACKVSKVQ